MDKKENPKASKLHQMAEASLQYLPDVNEELSTDEAHKLIHELKVRQIELARQNEELRQAQVNLVELRTKYCDLFDISPVGYLTLNEKGIILEANLTAAELLSTSLSALLNKPLSAYLPKPDQELVEVYGRLALRGRSERFETWIAAKEMWLAISLYCPRQDYIVAILDDITERKRMEDALESQRARLQTILDNIPVGVTLYQLEPLRPMLTNWQGERILGRCVPTIIASDELATYFQAYRAGTDDLYPLEEMLVVRALSGESISFEDIEIRRLDGSRVILEVFGTPVRDSEGKIIAAVAIFLDITDRKLSERRLRDREAELAQKAFELEEINVALRILLKRIDADKTELEENIISKVQEMSIPYIEKIRRTPLDKRQRLYIDLLESSLREITSPFSRNLSCRYTNLTPMELQVANLVQEGKTAKEISTILTISESTVKFHKINLRKKFGLKGKQNNLRIFINSLHKA